MNATAKSIFYFSFYIFGMGLGLLFIPNLVLGILGFEPASEIWVRVLGLLAFCLAIYYFYCARTDQTGFFRATVGGRIIFFLGMVGLVIFLHAPFMLAVLGSVDLLGAIWTGFTLRQ